MEKQKPKWLSPLYVRNFIFGVEDSLVSTVGLISGIAAAGVGKNEIILTGTVLIFVEAFSMGVGSLLSEHTANELEKNHEISLKRSLPAATIMFISYFLSGFIPLSPYFILFPMVALWVSIGFSLISLFLLGVIGAKILGVKILRHGMEMLAIGGIAIFVGVIVGEFIRAI